MTRDAIAITCAAFVFALAFALPVLVRGWRWLGRRAGDAAWHKGENNV